jgi:hypothetical protein
MVLSRTFTLCVDGAPTIVFAASNLSEARQLRAEQWLLDDLCSFKTNGKFLCTSTSKLLVRKALPDEDITYRRAADAGRIYDELMLVFLIEPDGVSGNEGQVVKSLH